MVIEGRIICGNYYDSVTLMNVARELNRREGVSEAAVIMGSDENKTILQATGMLLPEFEDAGGGDLLISVKADTPEIVRTALASADELLENVRKSVDRSETFHPKSIEGALHFIPDAGLVMISTAGKYAAREAMTAMKRGLHVLLFSDNVPLEEEIALKKYARDNGLLMMGPDCGTAVINGLPLAFANVLTRGNIGVVAAAGTGIQEVTSIISSLGGGISQAIGTGGRDVKEAVGGIMFLEAMDALHNDPDTNVIVLIGKPPDPPVYRKIMDTAGRLSKPVVATFLGAEKLKDLPPGITCTGSLEECALAALEAAGTQTESAENYYRAQEKTMDTVINAHRGKLADTQRYIRGLFCGGTLCYEAQVILKDSVGDVYSNTPLTPKLKLPDPFTSRAHTIVDMGDDDFTRGRPHPMIDYSLRNQRIVTEAGDPETAVILLDVVLGYGSNMNPGDELAPAITEALAQADESDQNIAVVCSVTGTPEDPQDKEDVIRQLREAGADVMPTNAAAVRTAAGIVTGGNQ